MLKGHTTESLAMPSKGASFAALVLRNQLRLLADACRAWDRMADRELGLEDAGEFGPSDYIRHCEPAEQPREAA